MIDNSDLWLKRAKEVIEQPMLGRSPTEVVQFATSMLTTFHGPESPQLKSFHEGCSAISRSSANPANAAHYLYGHAIGAIKNAIAEVEGGLIQSLRAQVAGEILGELVRLGKEILEEQSEAAKNVASVLIAAAYEDLMRRMGEEFASIVGRPKLEDVVNALKAAGTLKGGEVTVALGFLKFRNDSLHADWTNVSRAQVESCISFIDALLVKHFS